MNSSQKPVAGWQRTLVVAADRLIYQFSANWLRIFTVLVGVYVGLPFLAPVFMKLGWTGVGELIYTMYRPFCHQFAYRSWFLFGDRPFYMAPAFQKLTGILPYSNEGRWAARYFYGNEVLGWKVAYCQRDVAIYAGILMASLVYGFVRSRGGHVKPLNWILYGLIGIGPIALDGFSQLLSQPPLSLSFLPFRESTPFLRTATGLLFGVMNVWLAYPYVAESMAEVKAELTAKFERAGLAL